MNLISTWQNSNCECLKLITAVKINQRIVHFFRFHNDITAKGIFGLLKNRKTNEARFLFRNKQVLLRSVVGEKNPQRILRFVLNQQNG